MSSLTDHQRHCVHIVLIAFVLLLAITFLFKNHNTVLRSHEAIRENVNRKEDAYQSRKRRHIQVKHQLFNQATNSKDPIVRSIAINGYNNTVFKPALLRFFNVYYNYDTAKQYANRSYKLTAVANKDVLNNHQFFKKIKNVSPHGAGNWIDNSQFNSEFSDLNTYVVRRFGNNIELIADVQYNTWHTRSDNQNTGETWFDMTFNTNQHKLVKMSQIYTDPTVKNPNND